MGVAQPDLGPSVDASVDGPMGCISCAAPPDGCSYVGASCETCGELVCTDGGGGGEACGPMTCSDGLVCCNASCGICTRPGEGCIDLDCADAGPPGRPCGTILGGVCNADEYCDSDPGTMCGAFDRGGVCQKRPEVCDDIFMPVCGCDGADYPNACDAHAAGTDDAHDGECGTAPSDCRDTGCPSGMHCDPCRAVGGVRYVCLPDGAVC